MGMLEPKRQAGPERAWMLPEGFQVWVEHSPSVLSAVAR